MHSSRLKHGRRRLRGSHEFIPYVWLNKETLYGVSNEEAERYIRENCEDFLCMVNSYDDEENDGMVQTVWFCSSFPANHDAEHVWLDNAKMRDWACVNMRVIETEIAEAWDEGEEIDYEDAHPLVKVRVNALLEFLRNYGWVWHISPDALLSSKKVGIKNPQILAETKKDLQKIASLPEEKRYKKTDLMLRFFREHPSDTIEEFRKMLDYVDSLGLGTVSTSATRTMLSHAEKQDCKCVWCGKRMTFKFQSRSKDKATWEHMTPRSRGGRNQPENYLVACMGCNSRRGNTSVADWVKHCMDRGKNVQFHLLLDFFHQTSH